MGEKNQGVGGGRRQRQKKVWFKNYKEIGETFNMMGEGEAGVRMTPMTLT